MVAAFTRYDCPWTESAPHLCPTRSLTPALRRRAHAEFPTRRLPAHKRKEQLLDVAAELFAKEGYARATTAQLAKAAGVTEPIIYRHFASKRDLFVALIERTAAQTLDTWEHLLKSASDPTERLRRLTGENPMTTERFRLPYRVFLQAITEVNDPIVHKAVTDHITNLHTFIAREVRKAQDERKVTKVFSDDLIAWVLIDIGLGYGILHALQIAGHGVDSEGHDVQGLVERILTRKHGE
ncbi:MAG: TetR/AcrR family transcriptional regulator [Phycisphaerales bacterium]